MAENSKSLMETLQELIKFQGYTQKEMAELVGVSEGTLSKYLNEKTEMTVPVFKKLVNFLGVSADDLIYDAEIEPQKREVEELSKKLNERDTVTALQALGVFSLIAKPGIDMSPNWSFTVSLPEDADIDSLKAKDSEGLKKELSRLLTSPNTRVYIKRPFVSLYFPELDKRKDEWSSKDYWELMLLDISKIDTLHAPDIAGKYDLIKTEIATMMKKYNLVETLKYDYFSSKTDSLVSSQIKLEEATKELFEKKLAAAESSEEAGNEVKE